MPVSDINVAAATEALEAAGGFPETTPASGATFRDPVTGQFASKQTEAAPSAESTAPETPAPTETAPAASPAAPEAGTEEPTFTHIDPATLTPELQQLHRSLQADYTRKTQEAAPWRKLATEFQVENPDEFRSALEIYQRLQDPRNWPIMHQELSDYMQQYGMSPAQANQAAANQLAQMAPAESEVDFTEYEGAAPDPRIDALTQQIQQLTQLVTQDQVQRQQQAQWQQVAQQLTTQEQAIRAQNPHYADSDIEAIYSLMGNDGNLAAAQQKYESIIGSRLSQYLAGKQSTQAATPVPAQGGTVDTQQPAAHEDQKIEARDRFEMGHQAAMAHLRQLEREAAQS